MSSTLPTGNIQPADTEQAFLPQRKATKLNQMVDVSRAPAVAGDSLVYQENGEWAPEDVTPGSGEITNDMLAPGSVSSDKIQDAAVTDQNIGIRTVVDTTAAAATGFLTDILGGLAHLIKQITGKSSWLTSPAISLETLNLHKSRHATGGADALSPADIGAATSTHGHNPATTSVAGFMSTTDKTKLDGIEASATNTPLASTTPTAEGIGSTGSVGTGTTVARADHRHANPSLVTTSVDGFMSAADKTKLNGVATSAAAVTTGTVPITPTSNLGAVGTGTDAAREDHRHAMPSGANMLSNLLTVDGTGSLLDADKVDGLHATDLQSVVGTFRIEEQASAARILTTTPTVATGTAGTVSTDGTYFFVIQADFLCLNAADVGVAFTAELYVNGGGTGIQANFTAGAINGRATVAASGFYFLAGGSGYELRVNKSTGASTTSKSEVSTTKVTGFLIA